MKMKRLRSRAVGCLALMIVLAASGLLWSAWRSLLSPAGRFERNMERLARSLRPGAGPVLIRAVTPFEWDRMFMVGPYTPPGNVNKMLGFRWLGESEWLGSSEEQWTMVFAHRNRVVYSSIAYRWVAIYPYPDSGPYLPNSAAFMPGDGGLTLTRLPDGKKP